MCLIALLFILAMGETALAEGPKVPQLPQRTDAQLELMTEEEICKETFTPCIGVIILGRLSETHSIAAPEVLRYRVYLDTLRLYARKKRGHMPWWDRPITSAIVSRDIEKCVAVVRRCGELTESAPQTLELE